MDIICKEKRSWNMSRIRSSNTKPELIIRSLLHRLGYRFRLHRKELPGKPDIVLPKYNTVIFVNGCFWHRHKGCKYTYNPKSKIDFWEKKFRENINRDRQNRKALKKLGWNIVVIWECQVRNEEKLVTRIRKVIK
jgi:DNA mismatch endonuclease, patch repair protein